jgi:chemosensory pili system protein ChpA (sensor histidine kinase/response regulator)
MTPEPPAGPPAGRPDEEFLEPFLSEGREVLRALAAGVEGLGGVGSGEAVAALLVLTHRLRGSAAQYGLAEVADLAGVMEQAVGRVAGRGEEALEQARGLLRQAVAALAATVEAAGAAPHGEPGAAPGSAAASAAWLRRLAALGEDGPERRPGGAPEPSADPLGARLRAFAREQPDVLEFFGPEAREQAEGLAIALADLAAGTPGREPIESAFRLAHTLKGAAYVAECEPLGDLAHAMEDLLGPAREGRLTIRGAALKALEDATDVLHRMVAALYGSPVAVDRPFQEAVARLRRLAAGEAEEAGAPAAAPPRESGERLPAPAPPFAAPAGEPRAGSIRVGLERIDQVMSLVGEAVVSRGRLALHRERLEGIQRLFAVSRGRMARVVEQMEQRHLRPPAGDDGGGAAAGARPAAAVPHLDLAEFSDLELDRYDALDLLARQIAEISYDLGETQGELVALDRLLGGELERSGKLLKQLRAAVGRARMLSLGRLFERSRRQVERHARTQGRSVRLEVEGESVELDTAVVERIAEPLLHLIANALAHGIESPEERRAAGKPAEAVVGLRARVQGAFVDLEVEDDGRGLDAAELRRRAVELGLRGAEEAAALSDAEALELIFAPGLSTAAAVTETAGRGIGMEVVRAAVAELNGQIHTETLAGQGTRFTLRLPATLVVSTALRVRLESETYAIPTLNVRRLLRLGPSDVEPDGGREWIRLDGQRVEVLRLARHLGLDADSRREPLARETLEVVVVQALGRELALVVDELLGIGEVVVKGLGGFLAGVPGFSGVTVGADGKIVLLLDPASLPGAAARGGARRPVKPAAEPALAVLLADDSVSVRRIVGRHLTAAGYRVVAVQDGEQALEALRERPFAALITDLEMPRLNGFELLDMVRRRPATRDVATIVITSRAGRKHREQAARLGAAAYFSKPIDLEALLATLAAITAPLRPAGAFAGAARAAGRAGQR